MDYNFNTIVTEAECDSYLQQLQRNLNELSMRLDDKRIKVTESLQLLEILPARFAAIEAAIAAKQARLVSITEPKRQREIEIEINVLENKVIRLQNKLDRMKRDDIFKSQLRIALIEAEMAVMIECKAALELRKAEILAAAT